MGPASVSAAPRPRDPAPPAPWREVPAAGPAPPPAAPPPAARPTTVPALWAAAKAAFGGGRVPSDAELAALGAALARVPLADLGLDNGALSPPSASPSPPRAASPDAGEAALGRLGLDSPPRGGGGGGGEGGTVRRPPIAYRHVAEDDELSLGVFLLPAGAVIPLHNHPGMTVLSRVLTGRIAVRSFDWAPPDAAATTPAAAASGAPAQPPSPWRDAVLVTDGVLAAGDPPASLRPAAGGNIHSFTALEPSAVLDLLSPPYRADADRDCTYYEEAPPPPGCRRASRPGTRARLRVVGAPSWFVVERAEYAGKGVGGD